MYTCKGRITELYSYMYMGSLQNRQYIYMHLLNFHEMSIKYLYWYRLLAVIIEKMNYLCEISNHLRCLQINYQSGNICQRNLKSAKCSDSVCK